MRSPKSREIMTFVCNHQVAKSREILMFVCLQKRDQTMMWHHDARVNLHQGWKQTRIRVCFHLWGELTSTMSTIDLCGITALFDVFLETHKHQNLTRPRPPNSLMCTGQNLTSAQSANYVWNRQTSGVIAKDRSQSADICWFAPWWPCESY